MFLEDTSVWLERLLEQEKSEEVGRFLGLTPSDKLFLTDFAFHSIGIVLTKLDRKDALLRFIQDAFIDGDVTLVHLEPEDTRNLVNIMEQFDLEFDDAYQYAAAEKSMWVE